MSKVTRPEPVAYLRSDQLKKLGDPHKFTVGVHSKSSSAMLRVVATKELAEQYGHSVAIITTDQAEAYKDACVREALERAEHRLRSTKMRNIDSFCGSTATFCADIIEAMISRIKK